MHRGLTRGAERAGDYGPRGVAAAPSGGAETWATMIVHAGSDPETTKATRFRLVVPLTVLFASGVLLVLDWDNPGLTTSRLVLIVGVGLVTVAAGLLVRSNGEVHLGDLLALGGAAWLIERALRAIPNGLAATLGALLTGLWIAFLLHAVIAFPSGRLSTRGERVLAGFGYFVNVGLNVPVLLVGPTALLLVGVTDQRNVFLVDAHPELARRIGETAQWLTLAWFAVVIGLVVTRALRASPAARRAYGFVWVTGTVFCLNAIAIISAAQGVFAYQDAYGLWLEIVAGLVPVTLALSLFAARMAEDRLVLLVADLEQSGSGRALRDVLRRRLEDPDLDVVYLRAAGRQWIDGLGHPVADPAAAEERAFTPIERGGKLAAGLVHDPVLLRNPERLQAAVGATALAIDNERLKAELRAQVVEVQASRARIVEAGDLERRRVERNLHDGAQQRLIGLALTLAMAGRRAVGDPEVSELLAEASRDLDDALVELRELAQGIHPSIITDAGLEAALETLAQRPGVPVELDLELPGPLPEPVEVGAYYVVAEALANVNKHAVAVRASVRARVSDGLLHLSVSDDGRGGAVPEPGSGLEGLADRVHALAGELQVDSSPGRGTTLTAVVPLRRSARTLARDT